MKFKRSPQNTTIAIYAFLVIAAAIVFSSIWANIGGVLAAAGRVLSYVMPFIYGLVLAFLLSPLFRVLDVKLLPKIFRGKRKAGLCRGFALLLTYLAVLLILAAVLLLILPQIIAGLQDLIGQITNLLRNAPAWYNEITAWLENYQRDTNASEILQELVSQVLVSLQGMLANVSDWLGTLISGVFVGVTGLASGIGSWLLGLILSAYILASHEKLTAQSKKVLKAVLPEKANDIVLSITRDAYRIFGSYLAGLTLDACILGTICFLAMSIFNWPYAVLTSVLIGVSNMIPFFGPFFGIATGVLLQLAINPLNALGFLIYAVVMQQVDANIFTPRIIGSSVGLPPLWVHHLQRVIPRLVFQAKRPVPDTALAHWVLPQRPRQMTVPRG